MPLVHQVFQPLVENDIAPPARAELSTMCKRQPSQFRVPVITTEAHGFSEMAVEVGANLHVGICNADALFLEKIRQGQGDRVPAAIENFQVQIAISRNA